MNASLPLGRPVLLQTLWLFVMLNYLYADVLGLFDPLILRQVLRGSVDGLALTRPFLPCFRRHFDYNADHGDGPRWNQALATLAADTSLEEVILSGGDPLSLGNARLADLLNRIAALPHVRRLRIHTRTPIVLPARVDVGLLDALAPLRDRLVVVVHANHPAELDTATTAALRSLSEVCTAMLNQSVLLAGVNADATCLAELSRQLFAARTLPYYLHQLDPVAGAAHFAVSDDSALKLHRELNARLPGYLVPRLVREVPSAPGKLPLPT